MLDFVNEAEDIYRAFKPYYDATSLQEASDPQQLEKLKHELDAAQVYYWSEVEAFARVFYKPVARQSAQDHARNATAPPAGSGPLQGDGGRAEAQRVPREAERLREHLLVHEPDHALRRSRPGDALQLRRFLLPHLPLDRDTERVKIGDEVGLQYYRLAADLLRRDHAARRRTRRREKPDRCRHRQGER